MDNLTRSFSDFNQSVEKSYPIIPGEIGISLGGSRITEVPGRGQFVYVRLRSNQSEIVQVFNGKVFPGYGLPVLVKWNNNRYEIIGVDVQRYQQWVADNPHIAKHGATHSMDKEGDRIGTDPVWVYPYQFMPSLVSPFPQSGIQNVYINPLMVQYGGDWKYIGNTGTSNLATYKPTSGSSIVLISLDVTSGNPYLYSTTGTYIPLSTTGTSDLLSYLPSLDLGRYIPLSFILLASGTSGITWNNLYDVRQFFTPLPTGSSFLSVNGIYPINSITTSGANVSYSGTLAFLEFVGGGGGSGDPTIRFHVEGTIETGTSMSQPYLITDSYTSSYAYLYADYLGSTGTTRVDIKKNGVSIFTGGFTLNLPYNLTGSWIRAVPFYTSYVQGDILQLDIVEKATGARDLEAFIVPSASGGGSSSLVVETLGGTPSVSGVEKIIFPSGTVTNSGSGQVTIVYNSAELDYVQVTGSVSPTATTEATANTVITGNAITYDGNTIIMVEFFSPVSRADPSAAARNLHIVLYQNGSSIGRIGQTTTPAANADGKPIHTFRRLTPSAGVHTFSIRAYVDAGTGLVGAGGGGSGSLMPMFIRITRA